MDNNFKKGKQLVDTFDIDGVYQNFNTQNCRHQ